MHLFLFLNDLAGRWPLLDGAARLFYVGALPALGTLLLAQLLLMRRPAHRVSRSKTALLVVLAMVMGALLVAGFDWIAAQLHLGLLSPRPWMTRRVNWLVVEPQDNSFPCVELVLAAILASASWRLQRGFGIFSWVLVAFLALTRMFCGNNYFADVLVGAALGAGSFALCAAGFERTVSTGERAWKWSLGACPLVVTLLGCYLFALGSPRFEGKLGIGRAAAAAPKAPVLASASVAQGEGEGMAPEEGRAEELALAKRSTLFLPQAEAFLRGKLAPLARPFALLDVEMAPVKAGTTSYRCAAVRFEVPVAGTRTRRLVADRAAKLVRAAFALDSQLQNVDIVAVARDEGRDLDGSDMVFAGDEVPVFTASVQRKNLLVAGAAWQNAPGVDGGSWLRARSRIYINGRVLPVVPQFARPKPRATPMFAKSPSPFATGIAATPAPTATHPPAAPKTAPSPTSRAAATPTTRTASPMSTPTATRKAPVSPTFTPTKRAARSANTPAPRTPATTPAVARSARPIPTSTARVAPAATRTFSLRP